MKRTIVSFEHVKYGERKQKERQKWKKKWFKCLYVPKGKRWERTNKVKKLLFSRRMVLFNRTLEWSNIHCNTSNELNSSEIEAWLFLFARLSRNTINLFFLINIMEFVLFKSRKKDVQLHWWFRSIDSTDNWRKNDL
jgi:hypothetical protein